MWDVCIAIKWVKIFSEGAFLFALFVWSWIWALWPSCMLYGGLHRNPHSYFHFCFHLIFPLYLLCHWGTFNDYVDTIFFALFRPPPTSTWTFLTLNADKNRHFLDHLPTLLVHVVIERPLMRLFSEESDKTFSSNRWRHQGMSSGLQYLYPT